ncbi:MAG: phosphoribosyltransferase [Chitinophagales bacterium]|nr:phosphoribosyltransferase [Chitinophagales bacterium]HAE13231.1 phosphoribosyltransferase [Bacteroidota bacterium]MCB9019828.1 phosphoribosyltransferase [Chitinophagales bacterium]MCB9022674.1 phosphoribosyltransferase [Chitinophagales bacterium]HAE35063.1 phosphoribosyltransferase [Bacteroidota bacterium]
MEATLTRIADWPQVQQKIKRIAFEIAEDNYDEPEIIVAGICRNTEGYAMAVKIYDVLKEIVQTKVVLTHIELDKSRPADSPVEMSLSDSDINGKVIILVDDVSNSGRTLLYAMKPFLEHHPKKIQMAVLVERTHKMFPVQPDYVGLSLSTTIQEHITVVISRAGEEGIYLS